MDFSRFTASLCVVTAAAAYLCLPTHAQTSKDAVNTDASLRVYAVNVVKTRFFRPWKGYGIYLGRGAVITAGHVVGHFPYLTHPRVRIAGQELAATVEKQGSLQTTDLALLSIDKTRLPVSLRLRLNPLCKGSLRVGEPVVVVVPQKTARARVLTPLAIAPEVRAKFGTIISDTAVAVSGSGVFDAHKKCLLGIISRKIPIIKFQQSGHTRTTIQFAKYFVPAPIIAKFLPSEFRF